MIIILLLLAASTYANDSSELENIELQIEKLREHQHLPLVQEGLIFQSVSDVLRRRLPKECNYRLIDDHPKQVVANGEVVIHLLTGKNWVLHSKYPHCTSPPHSIFLQSLSPHACMSAIDFEWVECGETGPKHERPYHGQTYIFFCRESPPDIKRVKGNWIDGGSGLCSVFPTNWVPPIPYFLEVEPISLKQKSEHVLVTSVISHHISAQRKGFTEALLKRHISFHGFGSYSHTMDIKDYLKSFNSKPWIKPSVLGPDSRRIEKENAIRWSKFHLALDHISQNGYMSEKVWQALRAGTVPIYYGAPEARFFLPPKSTIFMSDFSSYNELIDYMLYLDKNDTAYAEYFQWREELKNPYNSYTLFLSGYGQGEKFSQHFCLVDIEGSNILKQLRHNEEVEPFQRDWIDWTTGISCTIPKHGCSGRVDFRDPPVHFTCTKPISLKPYSFP